MPKGVLSTSMPLSGSKNTSSWPSARMSCSRSHFIRWAAICGTGAWEKVALGMGTAFSRACTVRSFFFTTASSASNSRGSCARQVPLSSR